MLSLINKFSNVDINTQNRLGISISVYYHCPKLWINNDRYHHLVILCKAMFLNLLYPPYRQTWLLCGLTSTALAIMDNIERKRNMTFEYCESRFKFFVYTVWTPKNGTVDTVDFSGLCSDQQLYFFTLLDRTSFSYYNNTKIIKFGWELYILWVISYGLIFGICPISMSSEARLMTASAAHAPTHASIQPATKKSQCQWCPWIVHPC